MHKVNKQAVHVFRVCGGWKDVVVVASEEEKKVAVHVSIRQNDGIFEDDSQIFFGARRVRKFDVNDSVKVIAVAKRIIRDVVKEMMAGMVAENVEKDCEEGI